MSIYADFCLYLQSKHDQNTTILLDRHGLEMLKMAWIAHVFSGKKKGLYPKRVPRESNNFKNASHDGLYYLDGVAKVSIISGYSKRIMRKIHKKRRGTSRMM
jgi:hypothetical protein